MAIIGIDLGTTNSLVTTFKDGKEVLIPNAFNEYLTPSVVSVDEEGNIIVGKIAKERLVSNPSLTTSLFKRNMGTKRAIMLGEATYLPEELSSFVLRQLINDAKKYLNEPISEAVISVPAYFDAKQRAATKLAGKLAGIKVERLVNEPSAAALACRQEGHDETFIVFDFGGGTLDVSIVECFYNVINICAVSGDNLLGGQDFDNVIVDEFCRKNNFIKLQLTRQEKQMLLRVAEKAKIELQTKEETNMVATIKNQTYHMTLTNDLLFDLSTEIFKRIKRPIRNAIKDSGLQASDISKCILVGGSCHMPVVKNYLESILNVNIVNASDIDQIVAKGLGIYTGIKMRDPDVQTLVLTDICPFSLGTGIHNEQNVNLPLMSVMIPRNTILPTSRMDYYYTVRPGQTEVRFGIYQGENRYVNDNLLLDEQMITVPENFNQTERLEVTFTYDINAILVVQVKVISTGEETLLVLTGDGLAVENKEVEKYVEKIKNNKLKTYSNERYSLLLEQANRLFSEALQVDKDELGKLLVEIDKIKDFSSVLKMEKNIDKYEKILNEIEATMDASDVFNDENNLLS
jgi:molecular chaperone HscC